MGEDDRKICGGERPPKVPSSGAVLRIVAKDAGAIGYISSRDVDNSVKVVACSQQGRVVVLVGRNRNQLAVDQHVDRARRAVAGGVVGIEEVAQGA